MTSIWSMLEFLLDENVQMGGCTERPIGTPFKIKLSGFKFMGVVDERSPFRRKQYAISTGWANFINGIDALVLFASGFKDLIRPTEAAKGLCHTWKSMPKGKDYLSTTVDILMDLYNVAGCCLTREYLTSSRICWQRGEVLFEPCKKPGFFHCSCCRLQEILPGSRHRRMTAPEGLEHAGAVTFRRASFVLKDDVSIGKGKGKEPLYSLPNISIGMLSREEQALDEEPGIIETGVYRAPTLRSAHTLIRNSKTVNRPKPTYSVVITW